MKKKTHCDLLVASLRTALLTFLLIFFIVILRLLTTIFFGKFSTFVSYILILSLTFSHLMHHKYLKKKKKKIYENNIKSLSKTIISL